MKVKVRYIIIGIAILLIGYSAIAFLNPAEAKYDEFTKCLSDNGVTMYGAYWCPHCNAQKQMFGNSWAQVNYVECSLPDKAGQTQECMESGIKSYPTWEFQNGLRIEGEIPLEKISSLSGCKLQQ
jgi:glutaredoxin